MGKNHSENFRYHLRQWLNTAGFWSNYESFTDWCLIHFWWLLHYGKSLSCSIILMSNFLQYLILVSVCFSEDFCVCEYVDVEFFFYLDKLLLIVSKWRTLTYKCKVVWCFINGDNNKVSMKFFQVLFNIRVAWYWISVIFSFTFPNTFPFHGLKFEVVYLVLSAIASIHLSRALVISINVLEKFIFWGFL